MAIEKTLNTRIKLRYDLYTNWSTNNPVLLEGEVAFAYIPTGESSKVTIGEGVVNGTTPPQVLIKVGDGTHTYNELKYVSALAADVLTACKSETALTAFVNSVIADAGIASSEAMEALAGRVTNTENAITTLNGNDTTEGSVAKAIKDAIEALNLAGTYATKTEAQGYADAKDSAIAEAKKAGTDAADALNTYKGEMTTALAGKQDVIPENTYDAYGAAAQALADAKTYADENDADTKYGIEYDSTNKKIKLTSDTTKTEIDASAFIKDGMVSNVEIQGNNLVITFNTDAGKDAINVPLESLVDIYTGVDGTTIKVEVSSDDKISAEVKTGSIKDGHIASDAAIAKGKLAADVQTSLGKADTALQTHQDISHLATTAALNELANGQVKTNKEAIDAINNETTGILAQAKAYSDSLNHEDTKYAAAADGGLKLSDNNEFAIDDSILFIFDCGKSGATN